VILTEYQIVSGLGGVNKVDLRMRHQPLISKSYLIASRLDVIEQREVYFEYRWHQFGYLPLGSGYFYKKVER
jgi:hypothetical protein